MGKNVAVFVDVANIFYAAKAAGVDIDYVTLLKSATAGRDLVRAYAYTGLDPDNENQRNFHDFLRRSNYKVVSKDIRKYGDGKVKANLDIELVVDMMKTARNLDIAIVVSGDGDFAPAIRAVQEQGVRVEVISFRGNTSSDLIEVADQFTDIIQLARVEKGSRSGRRVADGDDLSMTEVPDKQTEGTGVGRGRGGRGGRGRTRTGEAVPVAAASSRGRGRTRTAATTATNGASPADGEGLVALPGERLSKAVGSLTEADLAAAEVFTLDDLDASPAAAASEPTDGESLDELEARDDDGGRRRRRRGGRGRGRGRGREDGEGVVTGADTGTGNETETEAAAESEAERPDRPGPSSRPARPARPVRDLEADDIDELAAPRGPRSTPFGSVWDSQLGTSATPAAANLAPLADDEDFDEPEIPEYLIAEQRRGAAGRGGGRPGQGGRGGPRGGRSAYQSAMERERYGRGGGGGINRYPDISGRTGAGSDRGRAPREDRSYPRPDDRAREAIPRGGSAEPWSEVPPELEAMLRAQVGSQPAARERAPEAVAAPSAVTPPEADGSDEATAEPTRKRRTTRASTARTAAGSSEDAAKPAAKRRTTTRKPAVATSDTEGSDSPASTETAAEAAPKRRTSTRKTAVKAAPDGAAEAGASDAPAKAAPKRRTTTRKTAPEPTEPA